MLDGAQWRTGAGMTGAELPKRITRAWLSQEADGVFEPTDELIEAAREFVFERWKERAAERYREEPKDLSYSCKFGSLFLHALIGGRITGNEDHQFVEKDGEIYDLSADAEDVAKLPHPYHMDPLFFGSRDHLVSMNSCLPRVSDWLESFDYAPPALTF